MELHDRVISKLICDQVLNSNMPDHIKKHVSEMMIKNGESYINLILHLTINKPESFLFNQNDYVLYKIKKDWKAKELGDLDVLIDKGYTYIVNHERVYLGRIKDSTAYGDFSPYDTSFNLETYGINDDLELKLGESQVDYIDILPVLTVKSTKLLGVIEKVKPR